MNGVMLVQDLFELLRFFIILTAGAFTLLVLTIVSGLLIIGYWLRRLYYNV